MQPILEVQKVSKRFLIHHRTGGYLNFRDSISSIFKPSKWSKESFWALKDISFTVNPGDSLAVIGRNGAGKSTLLKILSRITPPTNGSIKSRGRIASLLEVGTGFHPELSGRENIFFNGSLLGMRKVEIQKKFDAIVDFSGTEKFLDTPLKHFSSGMQLRLAFSVAAFLESEILILDEVLAVGDAEFQKKSLGKIDDVTKSGRTILFVSHNLSAVDNLCNTAILLDKGMIIQQGETDEVLNFYQSKFLLESGKEWKKVSENESPVNFTAVNLELEGKQPEHFLTIHFSVKSNRAHNKAFVAFDINSIAGVTIMQSIPEIEPFIEFNTLEQNFSAKVELPPLIPGYYSVSAWIGAHNTETYVWEKEIVGFEILESPTSKRNFPHHIKNGYIVPNSLLK